MSDKEDLIQKRTARALIKQSDPKEKKVALFKLTLLLGACFLGHTFFANQTNPLSLLPQTVFAIFMGMILVHIMALVRFRFVGKYMDWDEIRKDAELNGGE